MNKLTINPTDDSPEVTMDAENEIFEIKGKSLPEDVSVFYQPLIDWLKEYATDPNEKTRLNIKLSYFNTASSKVLLEMFMLFEEMREDEQDVAVNWYYPEYDEDMKDAGIEYSEMVDVPFEFIEYKP